MIHGLSHCHAIGCHAYYRRAFLRYFVTLLPQIGANAQSVTVPMSHSLFFLTLSPLPSPLSSLLYTTLVTRLSPLVSSVTASSPRCLRHFRRLRLSIRHTSGVRLETTSTVRLRLFPSVSRPTMVHRPAPKGILHLGRTTGRLRCHPK